MLESFGIWLVGTLLWRLQVRFELLLHLVKVSNAQIDRHGGVSHTCSNDGNALASQIVTPVPSS